jgi:hypothetical protein
MIDLAAHRYVIHDRDTIYSRGVDARLFGSGCITIAAGHMRAWGLDFRSARWWLRPSARHTAIRVHEAAESRRWQSSAVSITTIVSETGSVTCASEIPADHSGQSVSKSVEAKRASAAREPRDRSEPGGAGERERVPGSPRDTAPRKEMEAPGVALDKISQVNDFKHLRTAETAKTV